MRYEDFTKDIKAGVEAIVCETGEDYTVAIRNILKNNGVRLKAVSIVRKNERATPTIYLDQYYRQYQCGRSISGICKEIVAVYRESMKQFKENIDVDSFSDFERIQDKIHYKLVNYEMNRTLLSDIPHFKFLDLAIIFYVTVSSSESGVASVIIHNAHMQGWNKTAEELRRIAFNNTWKQYPPVIKNMEDIVSEMILDDLTSDIEKDDPDFIAEDCTYAGYSFGQICDIIREEVKSLKAEREMDMYVMTNSCRINGAATITYPGVIREFAKKLKQDIYIVPSSIHEVILIPGNHWDQRSLNEIVHDVNSQDLDPVDVLSDHVYFYSLDEDQIINRK